MGWDTAREAWLDKNPSAEKNPDIWTEDAPRKMTSAEPPFVKPMSGRRAEIVECDGGFVVVLHMSATMNTEYEICSSSALATERVKGFLDGR